MAITLSEEQMKALKSLLMDLGPGAPEVLAKLHNQLDSELKVPIDLDALTVLLGDLVQKQEDGDIDEDLAHRKADDLLLRYINSATVTHLFQQLKKYYS